MKFLPPVKKCPHCSKPKPCRDIRCESQYPNYVGDELPSTSNPAIPPAPKDYAEHLYMHGEKDIPQLGSEDCRDYFQPLDYAVNDDKY